MLDIPSKIEQSKLLVFDDAEAEEFVKNNFGDTILNTMPLGYITLIVDFMNDYSKNRKKDYDDEALGERELSDAYNIYKSLYPNSKSIIGSNQISSLESLIMSFVDSKYRA